MILAIVALLLLCGLAGWFGSTRKIGFWWTFIISIVVSFCGLLITGLEDRRNEYQGVEPVFNPILLFILGPIIAFVIALCFKSKKKERYEQDVLESLHKTEMPLQTNQTIVIQELERLSKLHVAGQLTEDEYQKLKNKLISAFD